MHFIKQTIIQIIRMNGFKCPFHLLAFLLVLCIRFVGSEENKKVLKVNIVIQSEIEIRNYTHQNVFKEDINSTLLSCNSNEWICEGKCVHKREYCVENSQCHPTYPIPCGDKVRCYRQVYLFHLSRTAHQ